MRILVTGGTGFLGRWSVRALVEAGHDVDVCTRTRTGIEGARTLEVDITDEAAPSQAMKWSRPDVVLHLAWYVEHGKFWHAAANFDWVAATLRLATAATEAGAKRFVGVGTCMEYDVRAGADSLSEIGAIGPSSLYATSKDAVRRLLEAYFAAHAVDFAWGRPFFTFGPHERPERLVPSIATNLLAGKPALISSGLQVRDFLDVENLGDALAALTVSAVTGPVNLASGEGISIGELAEMIRTAVGGRGELRFGALPDRPEEPRRLVADIARLRDEVGYRPAHSLQTQLERTIGWWRRHLADHARA